MKDQKRYPAANSSESVTRGVSANIEVRQSAANELKIAKSERHPASGCSPKYVGEVKATTKQ